VTGPFLFLCGLFFLFITAVSLSGAPAATSDIERKFVAFFEINAIFNFFSLKEGITTKPRQSLRLRGKIQALEHMAGP
jgi:hypothetical protein